MRVDSMVGLMCELYPVQAIDNSRRHPAARHHSRKRANGATDFGRTDDRHRVTLVQEIVGNVVQTIAPRRQRR
jgi:hypothetical protein